MESRYTKRVKPNRIRHYERVSERSNLVGLCKQLDSTTCALMMRAANADQIPTLTSCARYDEFLLGGMTELYWAVTTNIY